MKLLDKIAKVLGYIDIACILIGIVIGLFYLVLTYLYLLIPLAIIVIVIGFIVASKKK